MKDTVTGLTERVAAAAAFVLIGAGPRTGWLEGVLQRDSRGYVLTGSAVACDASDAAGWPLARTPLALETSLPGVFAAGDVRHRSPRGVAAAVADGCLAIGSAHEYLGGA